jgi:CubicO group peptidase (beta-lactamase class C family)
MDRRLIALLPGTEATPGTRFNYSDANAVLAAATVARVSARDLLAFARHALFKPLGFREVEWYRDHAGLYHAGGGLRVRTMDAAWRSPGSPFTGARIETSLRKAALTGAPTRPFTGTRIETSLRTAALTGAPTRPFTGTRIQTQYWGPSRHLLGSPLHGGAVLEANLLHGAHGCAAGLAPVGPAHLCLRAKQESRGARR